MIRIKASYLLVMIYAPFLQFSVGIYDLNQHFCRAARTLGPIDR